EPPSRAFPGEQQEAGTAGAHQRAVLDIDDVPVPPADRGAAHLALLGRSRWRLTAQRRGRRRLGRPRRLGRLQWLGRLRGLGGRGGVGVGGCRKRGGPAGVAEEPAQAKAAATAPLGSFAAACIGSLAVLPAAPLGPLAAARVGSFAAACVGSLAALAGGCV